MTMKQFNATLLSLLKKPIFWIIALLLCLVVSLVVSDIGKKSTDDVSSKDNEAEAAQSDKETAADPANGQETPNDENNNDQAEDAKDTEDENSNPVEPPTTTPLVDDWVYSRDRDSRESSPATAPTSAPTSVAADGASTQTIGLSAGGAKDIANFRHNIKNNYLPLPTDITHEGLFYDYFFETGQTQTCQQLFCPAYTSAVTQDPFSQKTEYYLAVGLDSNIKEEDFKRKHLNLVIVLDISGSMSSSLDDYYYDANRRRESPSLHRSKLDVAKESLQALIKHLGPEDRLGVVLFDHNPYLAKDLRLVKETDLRAIADHISKIQAAGGTNMEAGYKEASSMLLKYQDADPTKYENRIIFLTDAMPNTGNTDREDLGSLAAQNAQRKIYSSFIGIGVDFNTQLIQSLTQTRGANYFSVSSSTEFKRRLDEGFEYLVTPLVFDLNLNLKAPGYKIKAVYGSPEADLATGTIMQVNTLFPSLKVDQRTKGGLILLQLEKTSSQNDQLELSVKYADRSGRKYESKESLTFPQQATFGKGDIRKGIALSRLVNTLQDWLGYERNILPEARNYASHGIPLPYDWEALGEWERTSMPLVLSDEYRTVLTELKSYLQRELIATKDDNLRREIEMLDQILTAPKP